MKTDIPQRRIWIYGVPDKTDDGFPMPGNLTRYLKEDIFTKEGGRFRYTDSKNADILVLSRDGLAFGHFDVAEKVRPNESDRLAYDGVRFVYLVRTSFLYKAPVPLSKLGITNVWRGKKLSETEFEQLQRLAGGITEVKANPFPQSTAELTAVEALEVDHAMKQGFVLDSKLRKALELYAMDLATAYFKSKEFDVDDHCANHPYDLRCARKDEILFVEVKGTQTKGDGVFLTHGEVDFARNHKDQMALFVVHSIKVAEDGISLSDGEKLLISPWNIDEGKLKPISFDYELPNGIRLS
jgi:hypothetical protein